MYPEEITIHMTDLQALNIYRWIPNDPPKACVVIVHGMMEHAKRYHEMAMHLNQTGFAVYSLDLPGHGKTGNDIQMLGHLPPLGWQWMCESIINTISICREDYESLPIFLLGHSMGSYLAQTVTKVMGDHFAGLILSGTSYESPTGMAIAQTILKGLNLVISEETEVPRIQDLVFRGYNSGFPDTNSDFAWLSRDPKVIEAYEKDAFCGFTCTLGFYRELTIGLQSLYSKKSFAVLEDFSPLPILFQYGTKDPLSRGGKTIKTLIQNYKDLGFEDITEKAYTDARHEIYQETNRETCFHDLSIWLYQQLK